MAQLVIAGTHSGVGKTTVSLALMAALRRRGLIVQPFKVGPDFIDPGHHAVVCGRPSRNLDTWMLSSEAVRTLFARASVGADISVIEGVMGLFDGRSVDDPRGSTAHLAQMLDAPVLLVVDAQAVAGSIAAIVKGFAEFNPDVPIAAVLCNRVAGSHHYAYLQPAIRKHTAVPCVGWLRLEPGWQIPERHLGLMTEHDLREYMPGLDMDRLATELEASVDVDLLLELAGYSRTVERRRPLAPTSRTGAFMALDRPETSARIAVARDAAFCFYYQDSLDLLQRAGAEVVWFSPLQDAVIPADVDLVYLGGGYPELHAERLAKNRSLRESLREFHSHGGAIYAECGGLMYCCRDLVDMKGEVFAMLDLLPARTVLQKCRAALGYVTWRGCAETLFGPAGVEVRGHEFHYSMLEALGPLAPRAELVREGEKPRPDGFVSGNLLAGYAHLHFGSNPEAASRLVARLARNRSA